MALLCGVWCQSCFRSQSPGLSSWEIALYNNPCFTSPSLWWRSRLRLSARTALPPLRPTLCLFLRLFSAALLSHSPSPLFHTEAIISPARASRLASSTLGSTPPPPPLVGEAVGGWRPCGAGLLLGLRFFRGLGAIHIYSPLPALEDMRSPPRLKMGAFSAKRDRWSALVSQRVLAVPDFASLDTFERLYIIKEESLRAAREVLGTSGGKLRPAIRFH